jgi:hypothetical protein
MSQLDFLVHKLGFRSYSAYLQSSHWHDFKKWVKQKQCFCCSARAVPLQVHHITYERIGDELPKDVVTVCDKCHEVIHELADRGVAKLMHAHFVRRKSVAKPPRKSKRLRREEREMRELDAACFRAIDGSF